MGTIPVQYLLAALAVVVLLWRVASCSRHPLPPGPKGLPIIGNLLDITTTKTWLQLWDWGNQYGSDILYLHLPGQPTVIVNSVDAAVDLLEKRSEIYSDRATSVMDRLTGQDWLLSLHPYGVRWRTTRRFVRRHLHSGALHRYRPVAIREVHAFLHRTLDTFGGINIRSINQIFAGTLLDVVYGIKVTGANDPNIVRMEDIGECFGIIKAPGAFWVDSLPFLQHIPAWAPGGAAQRVAAHYRPTVLAQRDEPFERVQEELKGGSHKRSVTHELLEELADSPDKEDYDFQLKCVAEASGSAFGGSCHQSSAWLEALTAFCAHNTAGVETTLSSTGWFFLAMAKHPHVQRKAQQELDRVLELKRLPDHDDREVLPYCQALVMEVLRWRPAVPMGVPHRLTAEDEYRGYRIPAGAIVIPNAWSMLHNEEDYPEPHLFNPDRYLKDGIINPDIRDPSTIAFGFGRRICPGLDLAKESLFLTFSSILSVFDVVPAVDEHGKPVLLDADTPGDGVLLHPRDLTACVMQPRSAAAEKLVRELDLFS